MYLVAAQAIDDLAAGILEAVGHFNVVGLIKTGPELHQHHHLFAVFGGVTEGIHDLGMSGHAVQGNLDGLHGLILCRISQHADEALHALERIGQQHVLALDLVENGFSLHKCR